MGQTFRQMGWADREVKVSRDELLAVLKENRGKHVADYEEACKGYKEAALARVEEMYQEVRGMISRLKEGQTIHLTSLHFGLAAPQSHEKAYDQIIRMMEMSVDKEIVLPASQFGAFVMDDWDWKDQWTASNAHYMALAKK